MKTYLEIIKEEIKKADVIILGAGAGLSSAAGFEYGGKTFLDNFDYMNKKYGYEDMYTAGFHDFDSWEEYYGYWAKFIYLNRYKDGAKPLYKKLLNLIKDKNYFVITTNVDHQFQLAGFDKKRLFYTQGDYGLFQCENACHNKTYDNADEILKMIKETKDNKIPSYLVPKCPVCGKVLVPNLRKDNYFVEDDGWHKARDNYFNFLNENKNKKILFLEIGVGFNTPGIIKYPFLEMTRKFKEARLIIINNDYEYIPKGLDNKVILMKEDINKIID